MKLKRICINWENNAEEWWDAAREDRDSIPDFLRPIMVNGTCDTVEVTRQQAKWADDWMRKFPGGWGEPLIIQDNV